MLKDQMCAILTFPLLPHRRLPRILLAIATTASASDWPTSMCANESRTAHRAECPPTSFPSARFSLVAENSAKDLPRRSQQDRSWTESLPLADHTTATPHPNPFTGVRYPAGVPESRTASHGHRILSNASQNDEIPEQSLDCDCDATPFVDNLPRATVLCSRFPTPNRFPWVFEPHGKRYLLMWWQDYTYAM